MLRWIVAFLILAIASGVFGFWGLAGVSMDIARILFVVFLALFLAALIVTLFLGRHPPPMRG